MITQRIFFALSKQLQHLKPFVPTRNVWASKLRDYQKDAINECVNAISSGTMRIGVSMATGGGKTVIFSSLIEKLKQDSGKADFKTLVLVHRRELAFQAARTIKESFPDKKIQLEMGKQNVDIHQSDVIIASVQSLIRRLDKYGKDDIDLIIIDEAHHAVANSYTRILEHFDAADKKSQIPVVGFSATFERADNKALSDVIDKIVYHRGMLDMISDNWLCEGKFTTVKIDTDLSKVEKSSSTKDFKLNSLSRVMNVPEVNEMILLTYLQKKKENNLKSTLLFGVDIAHVTNLHELFTSHGIGSRYVTSNTKDEQRDAIIKEFKEGKIEILMNCGIFTEGTDMPNIDCILLCRPTRSRSLLVQMIGRGLRLYHSKAYCHIIDFVDSSDVGIISVPSLVGISRSEGTLDSRTLEELEKIKEEQIEAKRLAMERAAEKALEDQNIFNENNAKFKEFVANTDAMDLTMTTYESLSQFFEQTNNTDVKALENMSFYGKEQELLGRSKYPWVKYNKDAWALSLQKGHHLRIYMKRVSENGKKVARYTLKLYREIPKFLRNDISFRYSAKEILTSDDLLDIVAKSEEILVNLYKDSSYKSGSPIMIPISKYSKWRREKASEKQIKFVSRLLKAELAKCEAEFKRIDSNEITTYATDMNKGTASDILFMTSLAPTYSVRQLLKALDFKIINGYT
ncbi:similar to Saccharomyces cerevisiae YDR332W IRC3 Putative RNA helicase of the DEAH/D-box family [Maudiozyma barnettii]|uniref:Similar to Saccharomyces cerevisiae YDR332W IRC3 Putative RNA helicase of the DEAH/D-box family n=1 Tax=Maudiozyma barnettii TaxID=61262 RepID=A0A8H2VDX1_9SACH|nr:double-stranded DNA-dependent ATPase [Kazachstania barnettii]CAB4253790.1 similar to Saccharomyces cerevisiae YDR332W IRC3 Putative RNA helicase of the DEAH/D-box family [Kazachstania barnettii]CAD1781539.1 similar to Saccharomyces cerevisiae YDR332W IRC3 Putative RNA helicase of the DEAH/D-box family [Kazachstania barnettii]